MKRHDSVRYEMLVRVQAFGDSHRDTFPDGSIGGQAFALVAAAVAQLSHYALDKIASKREGVRMKIAARKAVSDWLDEIARTARVIAQATPGFDDPFVVARQRIGQTAAQVGIDAAIASGLDAAKKLDVIVRNQYRSDPVTRAVWRTQRRANVRNFAQVLYTENFTM